MESLKELGVSTYGKRYKIMQAITELKEPDNSDLTRVRKPHYAKGPRSFQSHFSLPHRLRSKALFRRAPLPISALRIINDLHQKTARHRRPCTVFLERPRSLLLEVQRHLCSHLHHPPPSIQSISSAPYLRQTPSLQMSVDRTLSHPMVHGTVARRIQSTKNIRLLRSATLSIKNHQIVGSIRRLGRKKGKKKKWYRREKI